jgi:8-oxo-dGTP diphosphatase
MRHGTIEWQDVRSGEMCRAASLQDTIYLLGRAQENSVAGRRPHTSPGAGDHVRPINDGSNVDRQFVVIVPWYDTRWEDTVADTPQQSQPIHAVGGVVYRFSGAEPEFLLIKKRGGYWTLPKGHVEGDETDEQAVAREIEEETGIEGPVGAAVRQVSYTVYKHGKPRCKIVTYYLIRAERGAVRPSRRERIAQARWFGARAALRRIRRGRVRKVAQRAVDLLRVPAVA